MGSRSVASPPQDKERSTNHVSRHDRCSVRASFRRRTRIETIPTLRGQPISSKTEAYGASAVGTLPVGFVELFARAGVIFYDLEVTTPNISDRIDQSDNDLVYSVGVGFTFVHRFNLQLEYEILDIGEFEDSDAYWLNASWRF